MEKISTGFSLKSYNTFGFKVLARHFYQFTEDSELIHFLHDAVYSNHPVLILGGGSNILFTSDFNGLVIHPELKGIEVILSNSTHVLVKAAAGETWDDLANYCVENDLGGLENLSWIPGSVGASPIQNIGAYGVEVKDYIEVVEGIDLKTKEIITFSNAECRFGYRDSIFKHKWKNRFVVTYVTYRLTRVHRFHLEYGNVRAEVGKLGEVSLKSIRAAIIGIRESKLPNPAVLGNAGSFFKNPEIEKQRYLELLSSFPEMPYYPVTESKVKVPASWLIDQCGWKGKALGKVAVHKNQALILVNRGGGKGPEVLALARKIRASVSNTFGIELQYEVNIL